MLEGEISQINLIERLVELWREQFTGAIRFENDGIIKIIYFKGGDILSASTNDRADSIDEILMRANKVSREHVKQALARRKETETLGDAMLNLGYITRKELTWARRVQVVGVIRSIAAWPAGSFQLVADYLPKRDEGTLFPLPQVLVELIVTEQDRTKLDRALQGGSVVFTKASDFAEVFGRLGLNEDAEAIVAQVDGQKSAAEVASASGKDAFNVYKLLHAFATLGILTSSKPQVTPEFSLDDDVVTDAADTWQLDTPAQPEFQFDETEALRQPTLEVPNMSFEDAAATAVAPIPAAKSAWDENDEDETITPAAAPRMPAWDSAPSAMAAPIPVPVEPPADADEEQWGFDEAQLEASKRATDAPAPIPVPTFATPPPGRAPKAIKPPKPPKEGGKRFGLLIALMVIFVLAAAAYGGFVYWQKQQQDVVEAPVVRRPRPVIPAATPAPAPTATIAEATTTMPATIATDTVTTAATPATTTVAPRPLTITPPTTPAPAPAKPAITTATSTPTTIQPLPAVTLRKPATTTPAASASTDAKRARLDEMARGFLANPKGNFTVQVQILCDPGNVEKAMKDGAGKVWFVPQTIGSRSCYRVFWGAFATREEAQRGLAQVPAGLRDASAAVKPVPHG